MNRMGFQNAMSVFDRTERTHFKMVQQMWCIGTVAYIGSRAARLSNTETARSNSTPTINVYHVIHITLYANGKQTTIYEGESKIDVNFPARGLQSTQCET